MFISLINTKKKKCRFSHIHRYFMYMYDGTSMCKGSERGWLTVEFPIPRHEISQMPIHWHPTPTPDHFNFLSVLPRLDPSIILYNEIRTHNLSMILMGRPQQWSNPLFQWSQNPYQSHFTTRMGIRTAYSFKPPGPNGGTKNYKSDRWTDINIYWSQTKIIQNFKFNFMRNDNKNAKR